MLQKMYIDKLEETRDFRSQGEYPEGVKSKKLDFLFYWRALKKNKWPITLFTAIVTAIAIYYSQIATPIYSANATLLLESQKANIISIEDLVSSEQESLDYFGTQYAILRSRALAERVIRQLELQENISQAQLADMLSPSLTQQIGNVSESVGNGFAKVLRPFGLGKATSEDDDESTSRIAVNGGEGNDVELEGTARNTNKEFNEILNQFRQSLNISPVARTKLVTIGYESTDAKFSALAANAIANQYIQSVLERRKGLKDEATNFMDERITELKFELDESEKALLSFKKSNGLIELQGGVGRLNEQELLSTSNELARAKSELSTARDLFRKIQNFRNTSPQLLDTLPIVQSDVLVRTVKSDLGQAQRNLVELRNRYGAKHPRIIDAESRLDSLSSTLRGHIERIVVTVENDYQLQQQRVASLEANLVEGKDDIQVIGQQKIILEALEREVASNRDQYNRLFDRITETRTTDGLDEANAVLAEAAWIANRPIKPNKLLLIGLAFISSLVLAAVVYFVKEYLDDTVNNSEDIERRLNTKLLGVLPLLEWGGILRRTKDLPLTPVDVHATSETFLEAVNSCRTALTINSEQDLQVILVTSSVPNEGKSTVALNLAYSFGQLERTLLIDCDLRRPSIAKSLDIPTSVVGLSTLLLQDSPVEECINHNLLESFDCLTSGPIPDQPLELLSSAKFAKILENLRQDYDKIIIDSAPTHVVSDTLVLSKLSDSVLYVVKPHKTSINLIDNGLSRLAEARASVAGICITQLDVNKSQSYGGFEFHGHGVDYHGYGNHYRYNEKPDKAITPN